MPKLINMDDGTGRTITEDDLAKLEQAIYDGKVSIDLGEAQDCQGDYCLCDDDYRSAVVVLHNTELSRTEGRHRASVHRL